jgi:hypothetical protein
MVSEQKLRNAFGKVKQDIGELRYDTSSNIRFINMKIKEQEIMIADLQRRLSQAERLLLRQSM